MTYALNEFAYCVEYFYAKPDCREKLIEALLKLVEPTRSKSGCLQYDLLQDSPNPNLIILLVKFGNKEMMTQHEQQPYIKKFGETELQQYCEKFIWNDALGIKQT